ncbi:MAG: pilus assembly protein [OCS116 cluster bacterium]|nr:pilus assembly protein [OCS116 cluster bacterium]
MTKVGKLKFLFDNKGSVAIEFAMLAPAFLLVVFGIIETGFHMIQISNLDNSVRSIVRLVNIGKANEEQYSTAEISSLICDEVVFFPQCEKRIVIELNEIQSFADIPKTDAECKEHDLPINTTINYRNGDDSAVLFLRVCIIVDFITPFADVIFAERSLENRKMEIVSSSVFMSKK